MADRVRFSPAPSGELHVGSARTALFNWLFARHGGGTFLLRVEDTDRSRTREEWVDAISDTLTWLGLDWDETPWRQSDRLGEYLAAVDALLVSGDAYESFETPEELEAMNAERRAAGLPPGYDGRGRDLDPATRERLAAEGRPRTVRFRTPDEGRSTFTDVVRGDVSVDWSTISDFVIVRSDGSPLFFLANAVDDLAMGITHVIRGEDLIDTTHRVLAIRRALAPDADLPRYAHLPLILQADRAKLSKRHGSVAVEDFRARGFLPEALLNYLALLGWAPDDDREVMGRDEIVEAFTLARVTPSAAIFDEKKLEWLNGEWIRRIELDELVERLRPFAVERYAAGVDDATLRAAAAIGQERASTLVALVEQMDFLAAGESFSVADEVWDGVRDVERGAEVLDATIAHVEQCGWTPEDLDLREAIGALGVKPRKVMKLLYVAIEGRPAGLPLFDSMHLLGRDTALARLRAARLRIGDDDARG
jgi:glutamyl-tRNA synthetase